jgi:hypothetical protein
MTVSKKPGHTNQKINGTKGTELNNSIDELENLISDNTVTGSNNSNDSKIPVLDEVVDPDCFIDEIDEFMNSNPQSAAHSISRNQLDNLIGTVDKHIAGELDALVTILKDSIKDSILTEIKSQLKRDLDRPPSPKSDSD